MSVAECEEIFGPRYNYILDIWGNEYYVDITLATNLLMKLWWAQKYKGDMVVFIDGPEGSGKSTLAQIVAKLLDKHFTEKGIIFDGDALKARFYNGVDWEVIIYDESQEGVDRLSFASNDNKEFNAFMRQSRQAHKILIMCGPSIFDISSYVAQHRVNFLIHCYKHDNTIPGFFMFFNEELIHKLFIWDKKERKYGQRPNFIGRFPQAVVCDQEIYTAKKRAAFEKFRPGNIDTSGVLMPTKTPEEIVRDWKMKRISQWAEMKKKHKNLRVKDVCVTLDISRVIFYSWADKLGVTIDNKAVMGNHSEVDDTPIEDEELLGSLSEKVNLNSPETGEKTE